MDRPTMFLYWKNQYHENDYATQGIESVESMQFLSNYQCGFCTPRAKCLNIYVETQKTQNSQSNLRKASGSLISDYTIKLQCWKWCLRVTARISNQSIIKEISPEFHCKDWCWSWTSNTVTTWCEELTHWKRPWCWERLKAGGEGDDRGWGGWMASLAQWTWVWASSQSWWWTKKPWVLQSIGSQRVRYDWVTELNWIKTLWYRQKDILVDQWNSIECLEINPHTYHQLILQRKQENTMEKNCPFNKWYWENWTATCKRIKLEHFLTLYTKRSSKWINT